MTTQQRWYDAYPGIEQSLKAFDSFPAEILDILLEGLAEVTEAKGCESEVLKALKALGAQKSVPLQKSQAKRRSYDKSLQLHQTMNRLFLLGDNSREVMAEKMMGLIQVVIEYFKLCRQCNTPPLVEDLEALTGFYARRGDLWARHFLKNLRRDLETRGKSKGLKAHRGSQDPYRLLGVGISATPQEIKSAYRRLARQYHPDVNPRSEEHFKEINDAYQKLLDLKTKVPTKGC